MVDVNARILIASIQNYNVTLDASPRISLWPLGTVRFESVISTFLPIRLSVMRFPQLMSAPLIMMVFSISVFRMVSRRLGVSGGPVS